METAIGNSAARCAPSSSPGSPTILKPRLRRQERTADGKSRGEIRRCMKRFRRPLSRSRPPGPASSSAYKNPAFTGIRAARRMDRAGLRGPTGASSRPTVKARGSARQASRRRTSRPASATATRASPSVPTSRPTANASPRPPPRRQRSESSRMLWCRSGSSVGAGVQIVVSTSLLLRRRPALPTRAGGTSSPGPQGRLSL